MKRVYWRPKNVSRTALLLISAFAIGGLTLVESLPTMNKQPFQQEKLKAARLAKEAFDVIAIARMGSGAEIRRELDPTRSGLIGLPTSSVTSLPGSLTDKQMTINPNFAAAIVQMLKEAGVKKGDTVAVGVSGSFPAINACTYAALEALGTKPIVIGSGASSSWGANVPDLLWLDMENVLADWDVFETRAVAASIGGEADRGLSFLPEGVEKIEKSIERNGIRLLKTKKFEEILDERMGIYLKEADGQPIKAYINVGGGMASVGRTAGKEAFKSGLNKKLPPDASEQDGIMHRFARDEVPVIHLVKIRTLAEKYGFPEGFEKMPKVGEGEVYARPEYNNYLAAAVLLIEIAMLFLFIRSDVGFRLLRTRSKRADDAAPEPMV